LIFSEHYIGIWGLIIGIPIFVFILDILEVTNKEESN
ncbi:AI-2E family transporter, partial [Bacillus altitudinis]|nr:AI-2E family transporter [Bacillus altitudinis]